MLNFLRRREVLFQQFGLGGDEAERRARDELFGIQNSRKAYTGMLQGLQDPSLMAQKQSDEELLRAKVQADPTLRQYADAWRAVADVQPRKTALLGRSPSVAGTLFDIADTLVFMAAEDKKPNAERLQEYSEAARESLLQQLYSEAPIYEDLELTKVADSLALMVERRGGDDPLVKKVLDGKSPSGRAAELVQGSKLMNVAERKRLAEGGMTAVSESKDPMIALARMLEEEARSHRKKLDEIAEIERQAYAKIADAQFAVKGTSAYPDATFTLRLAFGPVKGYEENGQPVPPWTTMGGAFEHERVHGEKGDWKLPASWHERKDHIQGDTPFNFVCTADIIGGNSGSPVVNKEGELVGVIFDGNIQSLTADYIYTDKVGRAVAVHVGAVVEALKNVYQADRLVRELGR